MTHIPEQFSFFCSKYCNTLVSTQSCNGMQWEQDCHMATIEAVHNMYKSKNKSTVEEILKRVVLPGT